MLAQRYRLERRLAQGGMAEVWLGTDTSLSRQVAVKLLKPSLAADPIVAERFRREAIAVAGLSHPNIVAVYDAVDDTIGGERRQAVVMQLVNGKSLRQLLDEQKRLSPDLTMHIGACVASALDAAHKADLVHRDVKPGNILITPDGRVLLTDFGIAKGLGSPDEDLTSPNVMMGTAKYLSPEQVRGKKLDGRADLYSLGLVLYECLAGRVPFLGETDADTALARLNREPTDLTRLRPTLPYGLAPLIHRLLARRPEQRFATGAEVRAELTKVASRATDMGNDTGGFTPPSGTAGTPTQPSPSAPAVRTTPTRQSPTRPAGQRPATGSGGQQRPGRPAGQPVMIDRTPTSDRRPKPRPNRRFEHRNGPSLVVVGGLLLAALVVGAILWITIGGDGDGAAFTPPTSVVPPEATTPPVPEASIQAVTTYDPDGDDGTENDDQVSLAHDGKASTAWTTVCYSSKFLGGKGGVGLVADLGVAATGTFTVEIGSAPYQVQVLTATNSIPREISDWGPAVRKANGESAETIQVDLDAPARYVLVMFNELGKDAGCANNPYRGRIDEMTFTPAG